MNSDQNENETPDDAEERLPGGVRIVPMTCNSDERGSLVEFYREDWPGEMGGTVQWNHVLSRPCMFRGGRGFGGGVRESRFRGQEVLEAEVAEEGGNLLSDGLFVIEAEGESELFEGEGVGDGADEPLHFWEAEGIHAEGFDAHAEEEDDGAGVGAHFAAEAGGELELFGEVGDLMDAVEDGGMEMVEEA